MSCGSPLAAQAPACEHQLQHTHTPVLVHSHFGEAQDSSTARGLARADAASEHRPAEFRAHRISPALVSMPRRLHRRCLAPARPQRLRAARASAGPIARPPATVAAADRYGQRWCDEPRRRAPRRFPAPPGPQALGAARTDNTQDGGCCTWRLRHAQRCDSEDEPEVLDDEAPHSRSRLGHRHSSMPQPPRHMGSRLLSATPATRSGGLVPRSG